MVRYTNCTHRGYFYELDALIIVLYIFQFILITLLNTEYVHSVVLVLVK